MPTCLWEVVHDVRVVVVGREQPADADWARMVRSFPGDGARWTLVVTEGGAPSPAQRAKLLAQRDAITLPTVVLTDSVAVRGVVTIFNWFGVDVRALPFGAHEGALTLLGVPREHRPGVYRVFAALRAQLHAAKPLAG